MRFLLICSSFLYLTQRSFPRFLSVSLALKRARKSCPIILVSLSLFKVASFLMKAPALPTFRCKHTVNTLSVSSKVCSKIVTLEFVSAQKHATIFCFTWFNCKALYWELATLLLLLLCVLHCCFLFIKTAKHHFILNKFKDCCVICNQYYTRTLFCMIW